MAEYVVSGKSEGVDFGASGISEVLQNIRTILTTIAGTVPLDRSFGINPGPIDAPMGDVAKARLTSSIVDALRTHEPRIEVLSVSYEENDQGVVIPNVNFRLLE